MVTDTDRERSVTTFLLCRFENGSPLNVEVTEMGLRPRVAHVKGSSDDCWWAEKGGVGRRCHWKGFVFRLVQ